MPGHQTGFFHHIGTFLLLVATVLLIITDISAPVVDDIALLKVHLADSDRILSFGTWGWCLEQDGPNQCSNSMIGYSPTDVVSSFAGTTYSHAAVTSTNALTRVMVLHPVATALLFIAFLLSLGAGIFGSLFAAIVSSVGFIVTVVALICDFVLWHVVRDNVNDQDGHDLYARYGAAIWCILVSAICSLLGTVVVFLTCCSGRLHKRRGERTKVDHYSSPPATTTRRRWWSRRQY